MSINWGEIGEGRKYLNKTVGVWKKLLNRGYLIEQRDDSKRVKVTFPYLNNDYYEGEVKYSTESQSNKYGVMFLKGTYYLNKKYKTEKIELSKVSSIFAIK